ncbi:PIR Superfamily Protein, partial [Plasmodium ovale curtisi]
MINEYELFKYCHSLISDEKFSSTLTLGEINSDSCKYVDQGWNEYYTNTCEKYKKFISYIQLKKNTTDFYQNCKYVDFLNFWLHYHLSYEKSSKFNASSFYQFLKEKNPSFFAKHFDINIHDIQQELFENMKNIYSLYLKFYDIYKITLLTDSSSVSKCMGYVHECISLYETFLKTCSITNVSSFCIALDDFKNTYNYLKSTEKCGNTELPPLPTYDDITQRQKGLQFNREGSHSDGEVISGYISDSDQSQTSSQKATPFAIIGALLGLGLVLPSLYRVNESYEYFYLYISSIFL